ncbi:MAG: DUF1552 domain-containing protein [Lacipirellulaceae bacterium]
MSSPSFRLDRRVFLRGLGACVALPALEPRLARAAAAAQPTPLRMAFVYTPNGVNLDKWRPTGSGADYKLGESLAPLEAFRNDLQFVAGLSHRNATHGGDGAGDHARASATFLTGERAYKTGGADIRVGVSVDQVAAAQVGQGTRFASLELACDSSRKSGSCDSGYACAYQFNLAWRSPTWPVAAEANPRHVFERLFADDSSEADRKAAHERGIRQRSVLDFVADDARRLSGRLGAVDRRKFQEYLDGVRDIERRIERAEALGDKPSVEFEKPTGIPESYREHLRMQFDLLALAFATDSTRIATFGLAHDGSNRSFPEADVADGHHDLSHHQSDTEKLDKIARIDRFYAEAFADFLGKLRDSRDAAGRSLLDDSMIVYGSGLGDGNRHEHNNLPVVVAGRGGGLAAGRVIDVGDWTPMSNLYVSMLRKMGVTGDAGSPIERFGDSTGALDQLWSPTA